MSEQIFLPTPAARPWWRRPGGIILIMFGGLLVLAGVWFGITVYENVQLIKSGAVQLVTAEYDGFSNGRVVTSTIPVNAGTLVKSYNASFGNPNAKLEVVMFGDFACPFTRRVFPIIRPLMQTSSQQIHFVYRDYPLVADHPQALDAAVAARCAQAQEKFWEYFDVLFLHQDDLSVAALARYAEQVGLDKKQFQTCFNDPGSKREILQDVTDAESLGVRGTPTFFVNGQRMEGVVPAEAWQTIISKFGF